MKTDRELLELAARACGYLAYKDGCVQLSERNWKSWSPLADKSDAFDVYVTLKMLVDVTSFSTTAIANGDIHAAEKHNGDPYVATRRAIVRAAAAIGEGMK